MVGKVENEESLLPIANAVECVPFEGDSQGQGVARPRDRAVYWLPQGLLATRSLESAETGQPWCW